jgi:hypothetical protein
MTYEEQTVLNPQKFTPQTPPPGYYPPANPYATPPQYGSSGNYYYSQNQQPTYPQSSPSYPPYPSAQYQSYPAASYQASNPTLISNEEANYERPPVVNPSSNSKFGQNSYDLGVEEAQQQRGWNCGALGDCCGFNSPVDHSALRRIILMRKVFLVVLFQLLIVIGMCSLGIFVGEVRRFLVNPKYFVVMWIIATILEFVSLIILFVVRHKFPWNFISLVVFTVSSG